VSAVEVYIAVAADVDSRDLRNMADLEEEGLEEEQAKRSRDEAGDPDGDDDERYNICQEQLADIHDPGRKETATYARRKKIMKAAPTITAKATQRPQLYQALSLHLPVQES
jgi:hypothetical protein